jgi:Fibronectin type III domain
MHGLVRRFAMAAGAIALAVSSAAGVAITTASPALAAGRQVTLPFSANDLVDPAGVAVDAAGDVFASDSGRGAGLEPIVELKNGSAPSVDAGFSEGMQNPAGLAVDAAGDVFGVSGGLEGPMIVRELQRSSGGTVQEVTLPFSGLNDPQAVAVDGLGDVFVADMLNNRIVELPQGPDGYGSQVTLPFTGLNQPSGVAVDAAGDVFVANAGARPGQVLELPYGPNGYGSQVTLPFTGPIGPIGVAVDGVGDVIVTDSLNIQVLELPRTSNGWGSQVTLPFTGVVNPWAVTVDLSGDVFVTDEITNGRVLELPRAVTPFHVPGRPGITSVTPGDGQATVAFTPSQADQNRGNPLTYTVIARAGNNVTSGPGITASGTTSPITVTGLVTGTNYTITVYATNGVAGNGPESAFVVLYRLPGQPKITSATAGNGQATVAFTPSQSDLNRGNPITSYTVTVRQGVNVTSGTVVTTASGAASPITVTGLPNGTNYTVTVYATNPAGNGPESAPKVVFPATVPGAPTNVTATNSSNGTATGTVDVSFTPPASNGGKPIQSYTAVSSPGGITGTAGPSATDVQVTGLTYGTSYTFTVYATNAVGNGPASAPSDAVTPAGIPSPPQVPGAATLDQAAYVSCLPPASDGGSPIVSYTVTSSPGGITATGPSCPILVTGLTDGTKYTFTVTATNADGGTSQPSQPTARVTPHPPSGKPPANDNFGSAQVISGTSGSVTGINVGATVEPGEQTIQDNRGGASVWYKWTVPVTGSYQFDTCSANPGVVGLIGLFTGNSVSNATEFPPGPSSDLCPAGEAGSTIITGTMSAGLTLYVKFDGVNEGGSNANPPYEGPFTLEWSQQS